MPGQPHVSQRFIQRLAEGVQRPRLVEPVVAARPHLMIISAPSGYGKTVLAAQIAASGAYADVAWISGVGESGSARDALAGLATHLTGSTPPAEEQSVPELCHMCSSELSALPDDRALLVVMDDASWAADTEALHVVEEAFSEAPVGSTVLVTTRATTPADTTLDRMWGISTEQLMLSDAEIVQAWRRFAQRPLSDLMVAEVAAASGRHAALVSLMARHAAFLDEDIVRIECTNSISSLVNDLVLGQLTGEDCDLLDYAAVLGEADVELLKTCSRWADASEGLIRIAAALPLVSVNAAGRSQRFKVHNLVSEARHSPEQLAANDPDGVARIIDGLADAGSMAKALEVAINSGIPSLIASCVARFGSYLLKGASWEVVRVGLDALPVGSVAADPALLLVQAEVDWLENSMTDAIRQAELAIRLAELSGNKVVSSAARSSLAGMHTALGNYSGAITDLASVLGSAESSSVDELADALYAVIPAYGFLADREGFDRSKSAAMQLINSSAAAGSRLARLELAIGVVVAVVDGDPQAATALISAAAARADVPQQWRAMALCNCVTTALEAGDLEFARKVYAEAAVLGSAYSTPLDRVLLEMGHTVLEGIEGCSIDLCAVTEKVISTCESDGEAFTLAMTEANGSEFALALGHLDYARSLSERGLRHSADTGSPILVWLTELVHAQAVLALGDAESARATAERILPQVESIQAMGHVLHARMILAQVALREGDLAVAVQHLSAVSDHIVEKSPALTVASYLRAFPGMLGPLAHAMGVDRVPARVLNLLPDKYGADTLEAASAVLTPAELARLSRRMQAEAERAAEKEKPVETDAVCTVRLFGGLEVVTPRGTVGDRDWMKRKARLLFAMLVSRSGTDVPRGEIIEYLWPEMDEERALNNFYVVWSAMKRALSPESVRETPCPFVEHTHGVCRVVSAHVVSDLDRFTELLGVARQARSGEDCAAELAALRAVADLYRGEVLPGDVYDDWFAPLRERFRHDFEDAMLRASQLLEERGEPHEGLSMLRRATSHDPWREDLYQASLRLQIAAGQRSAAIETYISCRNRLVADLGIDPSRETTALYEQVLGMEERPEY